MQKYSTLVIGQQESIGECGFEPVAPAWRTNVLTLPACTATDFLSNRFMIRLTIVCFLINSILLLSSSAHSTLGPTVHHRAKKVEIRLGIYVQTFHN